MKRRFLALLVVFAMVFAMMPVEVFAAVECSKFLHRGWTVKADSTNHWLECQCGNKKYFTSKHQPDENGKCSMNVGAIAADYGGEAAVKLLGTLGIDSNMGCTYCSHKKATELTCTKDSTCKGCGITIEEASCDWKDATCTEPKTCKRCGDTDGEPLGHDWQGATCTTKGVCANNCGVEGDYAHDWKDPTCDAPATCGKCGEESGSVLGHTPRVKATCTTKAICDRCGNEYGDVLGHNWKDATCTDPKTCKRCSDTEGEALGHEWKDATCTEPKTCKRDGCTATDGEPLGHDTTKEFDDEYHWDKCDRCKKELNKKDHTYILSKKCIGCGYINCEHTEFSYVNSEDVDSIISGVESILGKDAADALAKKLAETDYKEYHIISCKDCYNTVIEKHDFSLATFTTPKTCGCGYSVGSPLSVEVNEKVVNANDTFNFELTKNTTSMKLEIKVNDGNGSYLDTFDVSIAPTISLDFVEANTYNVTVTANGDSLSFTVIVEEYTEPTLEEILKALEDKLKEELSNEIENWKKLIEEKIAESDYAELYDTIKDFDKEDIELLKNLFNKIDSEDISTILDLAKDGVSLEDLVKIGELLPTLTADEVKDLLDLLNKFDNSKDAIVDILEKVDVSELEDLLGELNKIDTSKLEKVLDEIKNLDEKDIKDALENLRDKTEKEVKDFVEALKDKSDSEIKKLIEQLKQKEEEIKDKINDKVEEIEGKLEELGNEIKEEIKNKVDEAFKNHTHVYSYVDENSCKCIVPKCEAANNSHDYKEVTFNYTVDLANLTLDSDIELVVGEDVNIDFELSTSASKIKEKLKALETEIGKKVDLDTAYAILGTIGISMNEFKEALDKYTDLDISALEKRIKTDLLKLKEEIKEAEYASAGNLNNLYCKVEICKYCGHINITEHAESKWLSDSDLEHIKKCTNDGCTKEFAREDHTLGDFVSAGENGHQKECEVCKYVTTVEIHNLDEYIKTETTHKQECGNCDYETVEEKHNFVDGICETCKYECKHTGETGEICSNCNKELKDSSNNEEEEPVNYEITDVKVNNQNTSKSLGGDTFSYGTLARGTKTANVTFTLDGELKENKVSIKINNKEIEFTSNTLTVAVDGLSNGTNNKGVELIVNGKVEKTYTLSIKVRTSSVSSGGGGGSSRPSAAAQDLLIVTTDVGSAAQLTAKNSTAITISEKYTNEIIKKAEGGVNFTGSAVASPSITSIKFTAKLLKQLAEREDSNITEIGVDTKDASMRIKLSEILDKGDITITVKEATSLTTLQKEVANRNKLYNVEIKSSKNGVINTFGKNIEITLPYTLGENEDPDTITIYEVDKEGKITNLRGTYRDETAYCLIKKLNNPIMVIANPVEFVDYIAPLWAKTYVNQMASKNILLGATNNSYSPERLTSKEFSELLRNLLGIEVETSTSENIVSREETANIISGMMEGKEEYEVNISNNTSLDDLHEVSDHHEEAVNFAIRAGIMVGYADDTFKPDNGLTRTEAAVIFTKIFKIINVF